MILRKDVLHVHRVRSILPIHHGILSIAGMFGGSYI